MRREGCEGPKGDDVVGEERAGTDEIHRLDAELELLEPAADQGEIIIVFSHDGLQGPRLGDRMVRLRQDGVKPPADSRVATERAGETGTILARIS